MNKFSKLSKLLVVVCPSISVIAYFHVDLPYQSNKKVKTFNQWPFFSKSYIHKVQ